MFLIAITDTDIAPDLQGQSYDINDFKINSSIVTAITDNFLSKFIAGEDGPFLVESPLLPHDEFRNIIFAQAAYRKESNSFKILKSTFSGRPVYYHIDPKGNFFCSTHISMLRKAGVAIEENRDALPEYFCYRSIMPPATLYKNIRQLLAGSQLSIKMENGKCRVDRLEGYVPPTPNEKVARHIDIDNISNSALNLLNGTIKALVPCKDRLSVLLSGGLDSSILFKICEANYGIDTTYSTGYPFEDPNSNREKAYALSAADAFQTKHCYYEVTNEGYLRGVIEGISAAEEPLNHLQSVLFYLLLKGGIPQNKNIVISGLGADSIWGSESQCKIYRSDKMLYKFLSKYPQIELLKIASDMTGRGGGFVDFLKSVYIEKSREISDPHNIIWSLGKHFSEDWVCKYFGANESDVIKNRYGTIRQFEGRSIYDLISISEILGGVSVIASSWSKLGESRGKIVYYPYCQQEILNYAFSVPWELKIKKPKNILRAVARKCKVPEFIITRPKKSFGIAAKDWAERGKIFEPLVPLAAKAFDEKQIRNMQSSDPKKAMKYWTILNYSIWKRLCIDNEPVETLLEELK